MIDFKPTVGRITKSFNPRAIPGLKLWFDPSNSGSITSSGGAVTSMRDLSGNNIVASQATTAQKPTLVTNSPLGLTSLRFTAANSQKLTFDQTVNPGSTFTVFAVVRAGGPSGTAVVPVLGMSSNSATALLEIVGGVSYASGAGGYIHGPGVSDTNYHLISATFTGGSDSSMYLECLNNVYQTWTSGGSTGNTVNQLGQGDGSYCNGEVGEILLYSGILSTNRINAIHNYLWWKWFDPYQTTHIGAWTTDGPIEMRMSNGLVLCGSVDHHGNKICDVVTTTGIKKSVILQEAGSYDNHSAPAFVERGDGAVVAIMAGHNEQYINVCISAPGDPTRWSSPKNITTGWGLVDFTYSMPVYLSGENGGTIINFFRANPNVTYYTKSVDGGVTWSAPVRITDSAPRRPYLMPVVNGGSRIDFQLISGNPNDVGGATVNVYHMYYQGGNFYTTTGSLITLPFDINGGTLTPIWDGATAVGLNHDIAINASGRPVLLYTSWESLTNPTYRRAEWSGSAWSKTSIAGAGDAITTSGDYACGEGCFDPDNPNIVYLSRNTGDGIHQIWKYTWNGSSWSGSALTSYAEKCWHPMCVKGSAEPRLMFSRGNFGSYLTYTSKVQFRNS